MHIYGVLVVCFLAQLLHASDGIEKPFLQQPQEDTQKQSVFHDNDASFYANKSIREIIPCYCMQDDGRSKLIIYNKTPIAAKVWISRSIVYTTCNGTFSSYAESTEKIIQAGAIRTMHPYSPTLLSFAGVCLCNAQENANYKYHG